MNSMKAKALSSPPRGKRERKLTTVDRTRRPLPRWCYGLVGGLILIIACGYWWLNSSANDTKNRQALAARPESALDVPAVVERLRQAELTNSEADIENALLSLIELDRGNSKWLMQLCDFYFSQGRWSTATETFTSKVERHFSPREAYQLQGAMLNALINFGRSAEARSILNPLLSRTESKSLEMAQMEARLLRLEGKSQEALDVLSRVVPANHELEHLYKLTGILEFDVGDYDRAISSLKQASRLNPYSDSTQFKLAECARLLGDRQAERQYRERYSQLHAIHQELATLSMQVKQSQTSTDEQIKRLAELYESVGQSQQADFYKQQLAARRNRPR